MEVLNLAVGIVAILISVIAIFLSYKWSSDAERSLDKTQDLLRDVEKTADRINEDVDRRMDDLIRRAVPSGEEAVMPRLMEQFFGTAFQDPEMMREMMRLGMEQQQMENEDEGES